MSAPPPLAGIRVIDATTRWGELAGRVLAELGAEVFKIESPGGCDARRTGPFAAGESLYWACVGAGKQSIVAPDVAPFLAAADVFLDAGCHGDQTVEFPRLVHASITPFGLAGPLAGAPAAEITVEAAGGLVGLQGDGDRPPVPMGAMPQAAFHAGVQAAADVLVALYERERSGRGQHLDVSAQACIVWTLMNATGYPPNTGGNPPGTSEFRGRLPPAAAMQRLRLPGIERCKDGFVQVRFQMRIIGERTFDALLRWVEASDANVLDSVRGLDLTRWMAQLRAGDLDLDATQRAADLIVALLATKTKQEIQDYAARHGLTLAAIHTVPDLLARPASRRARFLDCCRKSNPRRPPSRVFRAPRCPGIGRRPVSATRNRHRPALGPFLPRNRPRRRSPASRWPTSAGWAWGR